ncbi:hypothetical protein [Flexivirga meconopsidis]|uniref:hypothetical protein n=1 Tax=Flexivirga meconopsidis TaxID=2977121 RepID=UPI00223F73AA|nr:hypothetical protein [Flexivirga meconopsidis]
MEPLPVPDGLEADVERLRRGWKRPYAIRIGLAVLVAIPLEIFLFTVVLPSPPHHDREHHRSAAGLVIGLVVAAVIVAGYVIFVRRLFRRYRGSLAPLQLALPFRKRRQLAKSVRSGRPSSDPLLRYLGTRSARLLVVQQRHTWRRSVPFGLLIFGINVPLQWNSNRKLALFMLCMLAIFLLSLPLTLRLHRAAGRYLRAVGIDPDELYRTRKQQPGAVGR